MFYNKINKYFIQLLNKMMFQAQEGKIAVVLSAWCWEVSRNKCWIDVLFR